jgi:hypothetical protein
MIRSGVQNFEIVLALFLLNLYIYHYNYYIQNIGSAQTPTDHPPGEGVHPLFHASDKKYL